MTGELQVQDSAQDGHGEHQDIPQHSRCPGEIDGRHDPAYRAGMGDAARVAGTVALVWFRMVSTGILARIVV